MLTKLLTISASMALLAIAQSPEVSKMKPGDMAVIKIAKADLDEIEAIQQRIDDLYKQIDERRQAIEKRAGVATECIAKCDTDEPEVKQDFMVEWRGEHLVIVRMGDEEAGKKRVKRVGNMVIW